MASPTPTEADSFPPDDTNGAVRLTLNDAHAESGGWEEGVYQIAGTRNVRGLGVEARSCGSSNSEPSLEFRLANRFTTLALDLGQDDSSPSSDQTLVLIILGNQEQIGIYKLPFNQIEKVDEIDIRGVNALSVRVYLDDEVSDCDYDSAVTAVLSGLTVT